MHGWGRKSNLVLSSMWTYFTHSIKNYSYKVLTRNEGTLIRFMISGLGYGPRIIQLIGDDGRRECFGMTWDTSMTANQNNSENLHICRTESTFTIELTQLNEKRLKANGKWMVNAFFYNYGNCSNYNVIRVDFSSILLPLNDAMMTRGWKGSSTGL